MRVLVTGACGQLGYDVCRRLAAQGIDNKGIDISDGNLTDEGQTRVLIVSYAPDVVIHCAAFTAVDKAESNPEECRAVNVSATENIAGVCRDIGARMLYISTDYVFGGDGEKPFETYSPKMPLSVYGRTKYEGELAVQRLVEKHFIVRISWAFGISGNNFLKTMLRLGGQSEQLKVISDQIGSPTYTADLSRLLCDIIRTDKYGVYHATNEGYCSWYEFAQAIMEEAKLPCQVVPVLTENYATAAKRPLNSRLSKRSLDEAGFARLPPWQDAMKRFIAQLKEYHYDV